VINKRDSFRLREHIDIGWSIPEQKIEGKGKIFNISLTGMSFETDKLFQPDHGMKMSFSATGIPSFPTMAELVWFKRAGEGKKHYQCGIRFSKDCQMNPKWIKWMEDNIQKLAEAGDNKILRNYLSSEYQE